MDVFQHPPGQEANASVKWQWSYKCEDKYIRAKILHPKAKQELAEPISEIIWGKQRIRTKTNPAHNREANLMPSKLCHQEITQDIPGWVYWIYPLPLPRIPVNTQDYYMFRLGNPDLNLHLPLESWVGGISVYPMDGYKTKRTQSVSPKIQPWAHVDTHHHNQPTKQHTRSWLQQKNCLGIKQGYKTCRKKMAMFKPKKTSMCLYNHVCVWAFSGGKEFQFPPERSTIAVPLHSALLICSPLLAKTSCSVRVIVRLIIS